MAPTVRDLFQCRAESYVDANVTPAGVLLNEALVKYDLFHRLESWYNSSTFLSYEKTGKEFSEIGSKSLKMMQAEILRQSSRHSYYSDLFRKYVSSRFLVLS